MEIAELVASLALSISEEDWARGQELIERATHNVEKFHKAQDEGNEHGKKGAKELGEALEKGLSAVIGYEGIKSIEEMVEHTVHATIEAKHFGERLGITTQAVQALGYAAKVSGSSSGALQSALQRLSFGLTQVHRHAGGGASGAAGALDKLGLSAHALKKLPLDQQLALIADKFKAMPDGVGKVSASIALFGRSAGPGLIPMLNQGSEGIAALREEAERLGVTTSEEGIKKAEEFERAQARLSARIGAVKDKIVMALLPALNKLVDGFSEVFDYLRDHERVATGVFTAITTLVVALGMKSMVAGAQMLLAFSPFILLGAVVALVLDQIANGFDPLETALAVLAGVVATVGIVFKVAGREAMLSWIKILGPIGLIVAGLLLIIEYWDKLTNKQGIDMAKKLGKEGQAKGMTLEDVQKEALKTGGIEGMSRATMAWNETAEHPGASEPAKPERPASAAEDYKARLDEVKGMNIEEMYNEFHIHGVHDPEAVGAIVDEKLHSTLRQAHQATKRGG